MQTREIRRVTLQPGEYAIKELIWGLDFIVVKAGKLAGKTFAIWEDWNRHVDISVVALTLYYGEWRSWRTLWRWRQYITAGDGCNQVTVTLQSPDEVPIKIYYTGKKPDVLK